VKQGSEQGDEVFGEEEESGWDGSEAEWREKRLDKSRGEARAEERRGYGQKAWIESKIGEYWGEQRKNEERNDEALKKSNRQEAEMIGGRL